jgi:hypothetical protein
VAIGQPDTKSVSRPLVDASLTPQGKDLRLHESAQPGLVAEKPDGEEHELRHSVAFHWRPPND